MGDENMYLFMKIIIVFSLVIPYVVSFIIYRTKFDKLIPTFYH